MTALRNGIAISEDSMNDISTGVVSLNLETIVDLNDTIDDYEQNNTNLTTEIVHHIDEILSTEAKSQDTKTSQVAEFENTTVSHFDRYEVIDSR